MLAKWGSSTTSTNNNNNTVNEAVIWDVILPSSTSEKLELGKGKPQKQKQTGKQKEKPGVLSVRNQKPKYQITDPSGTLAEKGNVSLSVAYNVQPWVGALVWGGGNDEAVLDAGRRSRRRWWRWDALKGGRSEVFSFPAVKGKKVDGAAAATKKA